MTNPASPEPERKASFLLRLRAKGIRDLPILRALETVPRRNFVIPAHADFADRDMALPIGCGQTTPEPFEIARLLEALALAPHHRVLEIGTGSGYLTALLASLSAEVLSIERFQTLALEAEARLAADRHANASVRWSDGLVPDAEFGLFDRIVVTPALDSAPLALLPHMGAGAILVFPLKRSAALGPLLVRARLEDGSLVSEELWPCRAQAAIPGRSEEL